MASPDLARCRARLERVDEQINDLTQAIRSWGESEPCKLSIDDKSEYGVRYYYFECVAQPPERLCVMASETLHNLRATLDNLVCRLSERNGKSTSGVNFPFAKTREIFDEPVIQKKVRKLSDADRAYIHSLKPYGSDDGDRLLFQIHDLNRDDKHVDLVAAGAVAHFAGMAMRATSGAGRSRGPRGNAIRGFALYVEREGWTKITEPMLVLRFDADSGADPGLKMAIAVAFVESFGGPTEPAITTLKAMRDKVADIVAHFDAD